MKTKLLSGVLALAMAVFAGIYSPPVSAQQAAKTWSVSVHIEYPSGFVYDHAFATGLSTEELPSILQACGSAHAWGSAVQYHCYAIHE